MCVTYLRANQAEPVIEHGIPNRTCSEVGSDVLEFGGCSFLIVVYYYSKYHAVHQLSSKMATGIVNGLKPKVTRHGIPDSFVSDNIPFVNVVFEEFARYLWFSLITSSPLYPQPNGQSERFMKTVKNMMRKTLEDYKEPHIALLDYRNMPLCGISYSPTQLIMNRRLKEKLPNTSNLLNPEILKSARTPLRVNKNTIMIVRQSH